MGAVVSHSLQGSGRGIMHSYETRDACDLCATAQAEIEANRRKRSYGPWAGPITGKGNTFYHGSEGGFKVHPKDEADQCSQCIQFGWAEPKSGGSDSDPQGVSSSPSVDPEVGAASASDPPAHDSLAARAGWHSPPNKPCPTYPRVHRANWMDHDGDDLYDTRLRRDPPQDAGFEATVEDQRPSFAGGPAKRTFETGATRDTDEGKLDFEGFLSPESVIRFAEYMHENRVMADGSLRSSDNWQSGIPVEVYMKSKWRHHVESWRLWRNMDEFGAQEKLIESLCAEWFNIQGAITELLKDD